jgi:protein ImuB
VQARTTAGDELARVWRCAEPLTPNGTADRVRWQLEGWLSRRGGSRGDGGLTVLRLVPEEVVEAGRLQLGLWGEVGVADERAGRALVRVQGLLGPEEVLTGVPGGGRGPGERIRLVPWGDERTPLVDPEAPWPGTLPAPSPARVPPEPLPARVLDAGGAPVHRAARGRLSAPPAHVAIGTDPAAPTAPVRAWGGPWPDPGRWWDPRAVPGGSVRIQVVCSTDADEIAAGRVPEPDPAADLAPDPVASGADAVGRALLLVHRDGRWAVEGIYD